MSAVRVERNTTDSENQAALRQEWPHLVVAFVDPDTPDAATQAHQMYPDAVTITLSAPKEPKKSFAAVRDIAEVLNGSSLIGIDLEDIASIFRSQIDEENTHAMVVVEAPKGNLESSLIACLHSVQTDPSTAQGLLVLIAAPTGTLMTQELRQLNKAIQTRFTHLRRFLYAVYETQELSNFLRMSLWTCSDSQKS
ncbi:hypothetical protein [Curvibacter sp. AEP1-3]|uniref:hypothetical protein n=1 Tax=Curvibacter sp. AEP1-3 TaxID=1844971 RepID=UPI000B3D23D7|nr:hypothetical protein [Curvibacter sp. AEP1-3]